MSLPEVISGGIRAQVKRFIWLNYIDPEHNLIPLAELPELPAQLGQENLEIYDRVLGHFLPFLFGNIALIGTSGKVVWQNVAVPIPPIQFTVGGHEYEWTTELNLHDLCPSLETFRKQSNFDSLGNGTFRAMCKPFAEEAKYFLKTSRQQGVFTNIYKKWPGAFEPAPWVAFDFAGGLNMLRLSRGERTVIERMTRILFRAERQKATQQS